MEEGKRDEGEMKEIYILIRSPNKEMEKRGRRRWEGGGNQGPLISGSFVRGTRFPIVTPQVPDSETGGPTPAPRPRPMADSAWHPGGDDAVGLP